MVTHEEVHNWIQWSRTNLTSEEENYPDITEASCPWSEKVVAIFQSCGHSPDEGEREKLLQWFEAELSPDDPNDIAVRRTAIQLYYELSRQDWEELEGYDAIGAYEDTHDGFLDDLKYLIHLLQISDCTDWKRIRWEILNAYAIRDWDLARALYDRAKELKLLDSAELQALKGQFEFLVVFAPMIEARIRSSSSVGESLEGFRFFREHLPSCQLQLDSLTCQPELFPGEGLSTMKSVLLAEWAISVREGESIVAQSDQKWIIDAKHDLSHALNKRPSLWWGYRAMLARCYLATEDALSAAGNYTLILDDERVPSGIKRNIYESVARSHQLAGEIPRAIKMLKRCADTFPDGKGICKQLAELQTREGDYKGVFESIEREKERDPGIGDNWTYSTILALGGALNTLEGQQQILDGIMKSEAEAIAAMESIIKDLWPSYVRLSGEARESWSAGVYLMYLVPQQRTHRNQILGLATAAFVKALELELKTRVFEGFRKAVLSTPELKTIARAGSDERDTKVFCDYLLKKPRITLVQMAFILENCKRSKAGILGKFNEWTRNGCPQLMNQSEKLQRVAGPRGDALHNAVQPEALVDILRRCREAMEEILAISG